MRTGHRIGFLVEALEPEAHCRLCKSVVPDDIQKWQKVGMPAQQNFPGFSTSPWLLASPTDGFQSIDREFMLCLRGPPCAFTALRQVGDK